MARLSALLPVLLIGWGCASTSPVKGGEVELLTGDAVVAGQSLDTLRIRCPWELRNQSGAAAKVGRVSWVLHIGGVEADKGELVAGVKAPSGGVTSGAFVASAAYPSEAASAETDTAELVRTFTVTAQLEVGDVLFEGIWNGDYMHPKTPEVKVAPQAARYDNQLELNFTIGISNPNPFALDVGGLAYTLLVGGQQISSGTLGSDKRLASGAELQFDISRFLGRDDHHELAKRLVKQPTIGYAFEGALRVGDKRIDTRVAGNIEFPP